MAADGFVTGASGRNWVGYGADVTLTLDYATARAVLVDQDPAAVIQAFFAGKITMQGDITKLMALQAGLSPAALADDPEAASTVAEVASRIRAITAD